VLRLIQENYRTRPIYFSAASGPGNRLELDDYLTEQGLVLRLYPEVPPDTTRLRPGVLGPPVDVPRTERLVRSVYRYAGLLDADTLALESPSSWVASQVSLPFLSLGRAYAAEGERERGIANLRTAYKLSPNLMLKTVIDSLSAAK
jgi:hypothetical protein